MNEQLKEIKARVLQAKHSQEYVLIETDDYGSIETHQVKITYVGDRWATGVETIYTDDEVCRVPYTINYSALIGAGGHKTTLIYGGDHYFA